MKGVYKMQYFDLSHTHLPWFPYRYYVY